MDLAGKIEKSSAQISVTRGILQTMQTVRWRLYKMRKRVTLISSVVLPCLLLQYYPEKLGFAMVFNLGIVTKTLVNIIWPFVE